MNCPVHGELAALAPTAPAQTPLSVHLRHWLNWVNGSTVLGLSLARAGRAELRRGPRRLYLAEHYRWRFPTGGAFTVGDVVITRHDIDDLCAHRPHLLAHEEVHSWQWMACLGLPFLPLYAGSVAWSWLRTGDRASFSFFERQAGLAEGGYAEVPPRPLLPVLVTGARRVVTMLIGRRSAETGAQVGTTHP